MPLSLFSAEEFVPTATALLTDNAPGDPYLLLVAYGALNGVCLACTSALVSDTAVPSHGLINALI
jgi:hypothetical protein